VGLENKYEIRNSTGQQLLEAKEKPSYFGRKFFGCARDFKMNFTDDLGREVIQMERKSTFSGSDVIS
jgi:hypothetical protein